MRIAYICCDPGVPVFGTKGASIHIQGVVRELRRRGHDVTIHAIRRGEHVPDDLADLRVIEYPIDEADAAARELAQMSVSTRMARTLITDPVDLLYERYSLFSEVIAAVSTERRIPSVLEVNAPLIDEQRNHRKLVHHGDALSALNAQVGAATTTVCVSAHIATWVESHTSSGRIITVPNGVDIQRIQPVIEDPDTTIVTFVGTLKPWHGVDDLIAAAAACRTTFTLRIIGDGPLREPLEAYARSLGVDADFRGAVAHSQIMEHLAGTAIAVAPYPLVEDCQSYFSPLKIYEYMAAGLPIIASDIGQARSVLDSVGVLVPPSRPDLLARALDSLVADPARRRALGSAARLRAETEHSWERVVTRILTRVEADHV